MSMPAASPYTLPRQRLILSPRAMDSSHCRENETGRRGGGESDDDDGDTTTLDKVSREPISISRSQRVAL